MRDIIIDLQNSDTWKIQLTIAINIISSRYAEEERVTQSNNENIKFASSNDTNKVVAKFLESLRSRYQDNLETSMRGIEFIFNSVQMVYWICHKVKYRRGGPCIDSPDWIKKKKVTKNQKNKR